ncbi:MAG: sulfatase-like hydrolase/transferase [Bryobacter sp.]|nr:sulfatase-like hydrolase/transferase [Bryobacter sp.]
MLSRRNLLASSSALLTSAAVPQKPNLLLILTDQQSHLAWSGARNPWLSTPAMDSLARAGTVYEEAYCAYPVCSPSRSSIFTGRMPNETGVMTNGKAIPATIPTLGEVFASGGYRTVYGGKWHLPKSFDGMTGFTKLIGGSGQGKDMDAPLASTCADWLAKQSGETQPFLMVASFMNPHDICEWIRQHPGARHHPRRHNFPPAPTNLALDPHEPSSLQFHRSAGYDLMSKGVGIAQQWRADDFRHYLHDYYRMVESVDREIGRVLSALGSSGQRDNTIICFASDHGEGLGAHRWVQKAAFWEETVHVPLFFQGPGIQSGQRSRDLVSLLDIVPTFCDFAGLSAPPNQRGQSLRPSLSGQAQPREYIASQLRFDSPGREARMLRTERYKYIAYNSGQRPEQLFDLLLDPGETSNLVGQADAKPILALHRQLLTRELRTTSDSFSPAISG